MRDDARESIPAAIRGANGGVKPESAVEAASYQRSLSYSQTGLVDLLRERMQDYDAQVVEVEGSGVAAAIEDLLRVAGVKRLLVPDGFPESFLPKGLACIRDGGLSISEMDACDGVLTQSTLAIALTGTIVLQSVPGQGRRAASLIPDYHLCLVSASGIVGTVPEAFARLAATATLPTTFISGPSATADIEMTRIKGVHGPRFLDVVLILE